MKQYIVVISLCIPILCGIFEQSLAQIKAFSKPSVLDWTDFEHALERAPKEGKLIMLAFHGVDCPFSQKMKRDVYAKPDMQRLIHTYFIPVELFLNKDETVIYNGVEVKVDHLATIFKVEGTPTLAFLNDEGDLIAFQPGFIQPRLFAKLMEYVGKGIYATMSFSEFTAEQ